MKNCERNKFLIHSNRYYANIFSNSYTLRGSKLNLTTLKTSTNIRLFIEAFRQFNAWLLFLVNMETYLNKIKSREVFLTQSRTRKVHFKVDCDQGLKEATIELIFTATDTGQSIALDKKDLKNIISANDKISKKLREDVGDCTVLNRNSLKVEIRKFNILQNQSTGLVLTKDYKQIRIMPNTLKNLMGQRVHLQEMYNDVAKKIKEVCQTLIR